MQAAAAGHLHTGKGHAFYIVCAEDLPELFGIVDGVQLRAADKRDPALDEVLVEAAEGIGAAVGGYQQICAVKAVGAYRCKLYLNGLV